MKRFSEEEFNEIPDDFQPVDDINTVQAETESSGIESSYKRFDNKKDNKNDFLTPSMKRFRKLTGAILLIFFIYFFFFANTSNTRNYISGIESGKANGVKAGEILSQETVMLEPKDFEINITDSYGRLELSIWNFAEKEDGDYVQVFVNGSPHTDPFQISHRPVKVGVPDNAVIQVTGIRDGSNNGITYGVTFSKTGETYLNTVPLNATNTYTIKTAQ